MSTHLVPDKHIKVPIWGPPPQSVYTQQQEGVRSAIWLTVTLDTELLSQLPLSRRRAFKDVFAQFWNFPWDDFDRCISVTQNPLSISYSWV